MIAKKTSKNQLTLPKAMADQFPGVDYFDVREDAGKIILTPVRPDGLRAAQAKMLQLGLSKKHVAEAVVWSRRRGK